MGRSFLSDTARWGRIFTILNLNFGEYPSLLKNPSTPLPDLLQGLKTPAIAVF
jgi:hypothetical protein